MNATLPIYSLSGTAIATAIVTESAISHEELMTADYVQLSWNSDTGDTLPAGAYITIGSERYSLLEPYTPTRANEAEYQYTPQFQSRIMAWQKHIIPLYTYDTDGTTVKTREMDWDFTGSPADAMYMVQQAIRNETGEQWAVQLADSLPATITLSSQSGSIFSVLSDIAGQCETEWWADKATNTLYLSQCKHGTPVALTVGENVGVPSVTASKEGYYTRFYVFGSTRNVTQDSGSAATNSIVNKRLTLDPATYPGGYIDARPNLQPGEIFTKTLYYDDIYPSAKLEISDVRARLKYRLDGNGNKIQTGSDDDGQPIYEQYAIWYFQIANFDFDPDTIIPQMNLSVSFETGQLAGRDFELTYHEEAETVNDTADVTAFNVKAGDYEILIDESEGMVIPGLAYIIPQDGDEVILYNIEMPAEYTASAREELAETATADIAKLTADNNSYEMDSNPVAFDNDGKDLALGQAVTYTNGDTTLQTRVLMVEKHLDYACQQRIRIGNEIIKGNTQQLREEVTQASQNIDILAAFNNLSTSLSNAYAKVQREMLEGFARIGNMWKFDPDDPTVIYSDFSAYVNGFLSAKGKNPEAGSEVSGSTTLAGLTDVSITGTPGDGQVLAFDVAAGKWKPADAVAGLDEEELAQYLTANNYAKKTDITAALAGYALKTTRVIAGAGLTGGGTLAADRTLALATVGTAGTYTKVTVDQYGRVTGHSSLAAADIPALSISKISGLQSELNSKLDVNVFEELFEKVYVSGYGYAIRAKMGLYSDDWISAKGLNSDAGSAVAGVTTLAGLEDVTISSPANGQSLVFRNGTWKNEMVSSGASSWDDLTGKPNWLSQTVGNNYSPIFWSNGAPVKSTQPFLVDRGAYKDSSSGTNWNELLTVGMYFAATAGNLAGETGSPGNYYGYGTLAVLGAGASSYGGARTQLYFTHGTEAFFRTTYQASSTRWETWCKFISDRNIGSYALTKTNYAETLDGRYVKKSGDTMTGALTINSTLTVSGQTTTGSLKIGGGTITWDATTGGFHFSHGLYSDSWISAKGKNSDAGGGSAGLDEQQLQEYLTEHEYVTQDWVTNKNYITANALNGYATQNWVNQQGYQTQGTADGRYFRKKAGQLGNNSDLNDATVSGLYFVSSDNPATLENYPASYGYSVLANMLLANGRGIQLMMVDGNEPIYLRTSWNTHTWRAWRALLDNTNYTSYTVTKSGGGASGTWGIGITGNAATASKLQTARTISLTGAVTGSTSFNGSANASISTSFNASSLLSSLKTVDGSGSGLDADLLDGKQATDFMRYVDNVGTNSDTLYSRIGIRSFSGCYPDSLPAGMHWYNYGEAISFPVPNGMRFDLYANHHSSSSLNTYNRNGLMFRTGFHNNTINGWRMLLDGTNYNGYVTTLDNLTHAVASDYIQVGSARLRYDSANNALYVQKSDGSVCGFYATGFVSAKGANGGASGDLTGVDSLTFTPGTNNRNLYLSASGMRIITTNSSGWGTGITVYDNANTTKLGDVCGAYGSQNSFTYSYFGGPYNSPGMAILPNKNVGIGTTSPTYKLHVSGTAYATGGFQNGSDIRYKHVLQDLALTVAQVAAAPSFLFRWTDGTADGVQAGTSAQYWQQVMPQVVTESAGRLSMQYDKAAMAASITTARTVVDHEARIRELEKENMELKERLEIMERRVA